MENMILPSIQERIDYRATMPFNRSSAIVGTVLRRVMSRHRYEGDRTPRSMCDKWNECKCQRRKFLLPLSNETTAANCNRNVHMWTRCVPASVSRVSSKFHIRRPECVQIKRRARPFEGRAWNRAAGRIGKRQRFVVTRRIWMWATWPLPPSFLPLIRLRCSDSLNALICRIWLAY